jgi:hypothetical protein
MMRLLFIFVTIIGLAFFLQALRGLFSSGIRQQIRRHPILHILWAVFGVLAVFLFLLPAFIVSWPPTFIERGEQRRIVAKRIEAGGGWMALKNACGLLASNALDGFVLRRSQRDGQEVFVLTTINMESVIPVPTVISNLRPRYLEYDGRQSLRSGEPETEVQVIRFRVLGGHATGGHSRPYYGLEVVFGPGGDMYRPKPGGGVIGNSHYNYRLIAPGIYEVF